VGGVQARGYSVELRGLGEPLESLLERVRSGRVTFVYDSRETRFNNAVALKEYVDERLAPTV
jgi:uncharacterized protein YeaO (DUF488 family)